MKRTLIAIAVILGALADCVIVPLTANAIAVSWDRPAAGVVKPIYPGDGIVVSASSTIGNGTQAGGLTVAGGATTTGAFHLPSITASRPLYVDSTGLVGSAGSGTSGNCVQWGANNTFGDAGSACGTGSGGGTFPFTPGTNYGAATNATSTPVWFKAGIQASTTANYFAGLTVDDAAAGNAWTTFGPDIHAWSAGYNSSSFLFEISSSTSLGTNDVFKADKTLNVYFPQLTSKTCLGTDSSGLIGLGTCSGTYPFGGTANSTSTLTRFTGSPLSLAASSTVFDNASTTFLTAANGVFSSKIYPSSSGIIDFTASPGSLNFIETNGSNLYENSMGGSSSLGLSSAPWTKAFLTYASTTQIGSTGNAYFATSAGKVGIGTTTPFTALAIGGGGAITTAENTLSTSTSMTVNWTAGNQQLIRVGTSATAISFSNYIAGQTLRLTICSPNTTRGAVTFTGVLWPGGTAPTLTTTTNKCDLVTFIATNATSSLVIFGGSNLNY